jgi:hypothetical protein
VRIEFGPLVVLEEVLARDAVTSIDRGGLETVRKFYSEINVRNLAIYTDSSGQALRGLGAVGLPTTLIINRAGQEVGRALGPAEWDAPEVVDLLRPIIADAGQGLAASRCPGAGRWRVFRAGAVMWRARRRSWESA